MQSEEKIERFRKMVADNPDNELARYSLGSALLDVGHPEEAETQFARALELKPDWVMAYILRARCLVDLGRYAPAKELLTKGREFSVQQGHDGPVEEIDEMLEELP